MRKGQKMSPEQRRRLSKACLRPEVRKKKSEITKASWQDKDARQRRVDGIKAAWADPETGDRMASALRDHWKDPKKRTRHILGIRRAAKRPEVQAAKSASMRLTLAIPEVRAALKKAHKGQWNDPKKRAALGIAVKKTLSDPKIKKRISKALKQMWASLDPSKREARVEAMQSKIRAVWAQYGNGAVPLKPKGKRGRKPGRGKEVDSCINRAVAFVRLGWSQNKMAVFVYPHTPQSAYSNTRTLFRRNRAEISGKAAAMTMNTAKEIAREAGAQP